MLLLLTLEPRDACLNKVCSFYATCKVETDKVTTKCICPENCPFVKNPVCGDNGETYANECQLRLASCKTKQPISVSSNGECGTLFFFSQEISNTEYNDVSRI